MIEHNNRDIANSFAEYITGEELRRYVADKVKRYCGDSVTVFDGAAGSGQLEQYVKPSFIEAVEVQAAACDALKENYAAVNANNCSFFNYQSDVVCDAVIMNPPFSIKFKDLTEEEKRGIQAEFEWKKSGVVDDIFVLKSLKHAKRYGFYILFPGVGYRKTEQKLRQLIGCNLAELNRIDNAFVDTTISVLFVVIDKQKTSRSVSRDLYDCKSKEVVASDVWQLDEDCWQTVVKEIEPEIVDIDRVNASLIDVAIENLAMTLARSLMLNQVFNAGIDLKGAVGKVREVCDKLEGAMEWRH